MRLFEFTTQYQVVCDGTKKGIFTDLNKAIANAKSMFKHEKEYYHIAVVDLNTDKEVWSWSAKQRDTELNEFAPNGFDGFEDDDRVPMHFIIEKDNYNRRSKWKKSRDADGVILFATKQQAIQAAEKFNKLDPNREFRYGGTQMVHVDDDEEQLDELSFLGSQCTKDCSGHRAGYEWSQRKGGADAASWSPSFNKGAWLNNNGF